MFKVGDKVKTIDGIGIITMDIGDNIFKVNFKDYHSYYLNEDLQEIEKPVIVNGEAYV